MKAKTSMTSMSMTSDCGITTLVNVNNNNAAYLSLKKTFKLQKMYNLFIIIICENIPKCTFKLNIFIYIWCNHPVQCMYSTMHSTCTIQYYATYFMPIMLQRES